MVEASDPLLQLANILDDQDTFLVKLPHSLKDLLVGGEDFDNITGEIISRPPLNPERPDQQ